MLNLKGLLLFTLLVFSGSVFSQNLIYPEINKVGAGIQDFTPSGWQISDSVRGDLNGNGLNDYAIVLTQKDSVGLAVREGERNINVKAFPRMLVILLYDRNSKKLVLSDQNNKIIPPFGIDECRFNSIEIANGILKLDVVIFFGPAAHETVSYLFRHKNKKTVCIGADTDYFNVATRQYQTCSFNFLTKRWWIIQGDNGDSETRSRAVWNIIDIKELRPLNLFREPLTWNVTKNQSI